MAPTRHYHAQDDLSLEFGTGRDWKLFFDSASGELRITDTDDNVLAWFDDLGASADFNVTGELLADSLDIGGAAAAIDSSGNADFLSLDVGGGDGTIDANGAGVLATLGIGGALVAPFVFSVAGRAQFLSNQGLRIKDSIASRALDIVPSLGGVVHTFQGAGTTAGFSFASSGGELARIAGTGDFSAEGDVTAGGDVIIADDLSFTDGGDIGTDSDSDLLTLADDLLTVNGDLDVTGDTDFGGGFASGAGVTISSVGALSVGGACRFGIVFASDYAQFANDGTFTLFGSARVLKTIDMAAASFATGAGTPNLIAVGNYAAWEFGVNDSSPMTFEIPHDWAVGTDITLKVDWGCAEGDAGDEVRWNITWSATPHDNTEALDVAGTTLDAGDVACTANANYLTRTTVGTIAGASLAAEDEIGLTIANVALVGGTSPGNDPYITHTYIEYTSDKLGEAIP